MSISYRKLFDSLFLVKSEQGYRELCETEISYNNLTEKDYPTNYPCLVGLNSTSVCLNIHTLPIEMLNNLIKETS